MSRDDGTCGRHHPAEECKGTPGCMCAGGYLCVWQRRAGMCPERLSAPLRSIQELPSAPPCPPGAGLHTGVWRGAGHSKALSSVQEVGRAEGKPSSTRMPSSSTAWPGLEGRLQSAGRWLSTRRPQASWLGAGPISQLWVGRLKRNKNNVFQRHCLLSALNSSEKKSLG